jgi:hypothetical protein
MKRRAVLAREDEPLIFVCRPPRKPPLKLALAVIAKRGHRPRIECDNPPRAPRLWLRPLEAIEAIQIEAGRRDARLKDAERRAAEAEKKAEKARKAQRAAESVKGSLEARIVETRAAVAGEVETLRAEKEMLATRDREAREELERLRLGELQRLGHGKQIKPRGVTAGG